MKYPAIVINFKTYNRATGMRALELARKIENVSPEAIICAQAVDLRLLSENIANPVFAQHLDGIIPGSHTGWILAESVKEAGAVGTLLNHSEHRISNEEIIRRLVRAQDVGLEAIVCARSAERVSELVALGIQPNAIAVEPPELIGGSKSISSESPEVIIKSVENSDDIPLLCGAGIKTEEDVRKSLEFGAGGVLVASGIAKADDPERVMRAFFEALK